MKGTEFIIKYPEFAKKNNIKDKDVIFSTGLKIKVLRYV